MNIQTNRDIEEEKGLELWEKERLVISIRNVSAIGLVAFIVHGVLGVNCAYDRNNLFRYAYEISEALIYVSVLMFPLYTTGLLGKIKTKSTNIKFNNIPGPVTKVIGFVLLFVAIALIRLLISKIIG